jgi:hypothetical protein
MANIKVKKAILNNKFYEGLLVIPAAVTLYSLVEKRRCCSTFETVRSLARSNVGRFRVRGHRQVRGSP